MRTKNRWQRVEVKTMNKIRSEITEFNAMMASLHNYKWCDRPPEPKRGKTHEF